MGLASLSVAFLALQGASAAQIPFLSKAPWAASVPAGSTEAKKDLISSDAIQALIKPKALLRHAEKFYDIAQAGVPEYNHPTRVIGSAGTIAQALTASHDMHRN
jgi:aminopeptidase Y